MPPKLELYDDHEAACRAMVRLFSERMSGGGKAVVAGGHTPELAFELLRGEAIDWKRVTLVPSDERCLPVGHADRNDAMVHAALGDLGFTLQGFAAEHGAEASATAMEPVIAKLVPFDIVLLGLGEDGHTASLFPGQRAVADAATLVAPVHDSPKPPPDRVTLTLRALETAKLVVFLVTGEGKREPLARLLAGADIPAAWVRAAEVRVIADRAAHGP